MVAVIDVSGVEFGALRAGVGGRSADGDAPCRGGDSILGKGGGRSGRKERQGADKTIKLQRWKSPDSRAFSSYNAVRTAGREGTLARWREGGSRPAFEGHWMRVGTEGREFAYLSSIMLKDLKHAMRLLAKSPGFALTAILTLALGIGANAVVFSVLNALVLRPVNLPNAENLYMVQRFQYPSQSYPDYVDLRDRNRTFESLVSFDIIGPVGVDMGGKPLTAWPYMASGNYFDALGVQPHLGRFYHAADEKGLNRAPCTATRGW
jgi:hypothetical protein